MPVVFSLFLLAALPINPDPAVYGPHKRSERLKLIAPVADGVLRCRPTFCSCGVCLGAAKPIPNLKLEYRPKGGTDWLTAPAFHYYEETLDYRGSILRLAEDTEYEVRIGNKIDTFRTWKSEPKVVKTVTINPKQTFPYKITARGKPDAWIRYVMKPGSVLENETKEYTIVFDGAEYVLLDNATIRGGTGRHAIEMVNSHSVRIRNCNISHWGRPSALKYDSLGRPCEIDKLDAKTAAVTGEYKNNTKLRSWSSSAAVVNFDGAIHIGKGCSETVVERCWIHDCTVHANSWFYSHPAGGEAIVMGRPDHSTVVRWNDFTGSDEHRWNDAVESEGNFTEDGGFNRDADIYGNFMIFCNDDCIELDGGQQNVRCFDNRFESALCGVSIQGCMASPVYVFRNGFYSMCEEFDGAGQTIKTGGGAHGWEAYAHIFDNVFWGRGSGITWMPALRANTHNNYFCGNQKIGGEDDSADSISENNEFDWEVAEDKLPVRCPVRDPGFIMSRSRFSDLKPDSTFTVTARSTSTKGVNYQVCINDDMPWLKVTPEKGILSPGASVDFKVSFDLKPQPSTPSTPSTLNPQPSTISRRWYRGCFLVRTSEGLSRGVSVYVNTDYKNPFKCEKKGEVAMYANFTGTRQLDGDTLNEFEFTAPKEGRYYFLARLSRQTRGSVVLDVKLGAKEGTCTLSNLWPDPVWVMLGPDLGFGNTIAYVDLKSGEKIGLSFAVVTGANRGLECEGVVMTDSPGSFEPR